MIGETISHYKILEKLGEGGMGVVCKAYDTRLKRTVALKLLSPQVLGSEEDKVRFVHEDQVAASLSHSNICTVYETDEAEEQSFIAMEYVEGQSLKEKIDCVPSGSGLGGAPFSVALLLEVGRCRGHIIWPQAGATRLAVYTYMALGRAYDHILCRQRSFGDERTPDRRVGRLGRPMLPSRTSSQYGNRWRESKMRKPISYALLSALLFIAISSSSDNAASLGEKHKPVMKDGIKRYGDGYVEYREDIPFIYLKGDSYEIGLQYGVLLRDEMKRLYADLDRFEHVMMTKVYEESPWYMDIIIKISAPFVMRSKLISFKKRVPDDYLEQLEGMSEGSGIPMDDLLIVTFGSDWLSCSSFIKKVGGRIIHGRNADHDAIDFFSRYPVVAHYNKEGKYSYIDIGIVGTPFAVTGINEHGLTLSWSQATSSDSKSFDGTGTTLMFNRILEECRDLKDVDEASKNVDRFVVMIGSLEDRAGAAYDIVDQKAVRTDLKDDYIYATNRCVSPSMREEYNSVFDMDWGNSARAFTYEKILSDIHEFTIDDAIDLLANTDFYDYKGKIPPFEGGNINNRGTGSSVVIDPASSTVYFAFGAPYAAFSRWIAYNYDTDEVRVYRDEDERLDDPEVIEYVELEKRWKDVNWDDEDGLRQMLDEMERVSAENIWTLYTSCWAWNALGNTEKTEAIIKRQIDRYPDYQTVFTNMGFLRMDQGRVDEAVDYYNKALNAPTTNDRKRLYCHEQLAAAYADIGDEAKSVDHYRKALDLYNEYWIPGRAREQVNRIEELLKDQD